MLAFAFFLALASAEDLGGALQLSVATPAEVADAVSSCRSAVGRSMKADQAQLLAGGWQVAERPNKSTTVFRHPRSAAVILTLAPPLGSCFVRARLQDDASIGAASQAIEQRVGTPARLKERDPVYRLWRTSGQLIGLEAFDDGPGSQRHVIQLVIGELPKEYR